MRLPACRRPVGVLLRLVNSKVGWRLSANNGKPLGSLQRLVQADCGRSAVPMLPTALSKAVIAPRLSRKSALHLKAVTEVCLCRVAALAVVEMELSTQSGFSLLSNNRPVDRQSAREYRAWNESGERGGYASVRSWFSLAIRADFGLLSPIGLLVSPQCHNEWCARRRWIASRRIVLNHPRAHLPVTLWDDCHIVVDRHAGIVSTVVSTPGSSADISHAQRLFPGQECNTLGDCICIYVNSRAEAANW